MTPEMLSIGALIAFALAAGVALAGFRVAALRNNTWQFVLVGIGMLLKTAAIGVTCSRSSTHFFNSPAEICGLLAWALGFSHLLALSLSAVRSIGAVVLPIVTVLMALSQFLSPVGEDPGIPASRLMALHILSAFLGYGLFLTACGASVLYLEQSRLLKRKLFGFIFRDLPSLERLERLEMLCSSLGLGIFIVALASGAVMARELNRPYWLDPKTLATVATCLVFGALVVGRAARWLHGRTAAKFVLAGAALVVITFALGHPLMRPGVAESRTGRRGDLVTGRGRDDGRRQDASAPSDGGSA